MAKITRTDGRKPTKQERIDALMQLGETKESATFIVALEDGDVGGDVVIVDNDGNVTGYTASKPIFLDDTQ